MAVIQGRTRKQIRQAVGYNLNAVHVSAASANGTTATLVDNTLVIGGTDEHKGKYILFTSGANDGLVSRVTGSSVTTFVTTLTFYPARTSTVSADTYELWGWAGEGLLPSRIHEFLTQAVIEATGAAYVDVESLALHGDSVTSRLAVPSGITALRRIDYRSSFSAVDINRCDSVWTEQVLATVTASADDEDKKEGSASLKLVVAAGAAANAILASQAITSLDLSGYDTIEFWAKSTVAEAAGGLQLLLDDTALCASPLETLNLPALVADTWTFCRLTLANPETDTAIISVGLKYVTDIGACVIWLDDIRAVKNSQSRWTKLDNTLWSVNRQAQEIVLSRGGRNAVGYNLLKLVGYNSPTPLSSDTATSDISDTYVIAEATALAYASGAGGANTDPDNRAARAAFWMGKAELAKASFPLLVDVRPVK